MERASSSGSRTVEIKVISGEGLRVNRTTPVKKNTFVIVRSESREGQATRVDTEGGSCPVWNEKFVVDMPMHARFVTAEVQCRTSTGNKVIGTAKIPVSDFVGGYVPKNYLHFLSYRLRDDKGERNGIINLSVKVRAAESDCGKYPMAGNAGHADSVIARLALAEESVARAVRKVSRQLVLEFLRIDS
ncbi:hypothetical protein RJ639_045621 [Escallonia herrerae]|uniref:C2 domain-containing protein n=1 Tax=Escallonia herrerae TaxID=1293975 RepID=A0AA88W5U3_9ASTE|nr:hypothetical protein RJ639_045621 [Escallonia herrerae]